MGVLTMNQDVQPFVLDQHEQDFAKFREMQPEEIKKISGAGWWNAQKNSCPTGTSTPNGDGGDDGSDND